MILINANKFYHQPFFKPEHETIFIEQLWKLMRIPFFSTSLHDATLLLCFPFIAEAEVLIVTIINVMLLWEETNKAKTVLALPKIDVVIIFSVIRMKKCTAQQLVKFQFFHIFSWNLRECFSRDINTALKMPSILSTKITTRCSSATKKEMRRNQ